MVEGTVFTLALVFVVAGALLLVANQLDLSPVPFYILAGLIVGPVLDPPDVFELALWGIAFLVFAFGIRVEFQALGSILRDAETAAVTQLVVVAPVAFLVAFALGHWTGLADPISNGIYFAAAATFSSTVVGARRLEQGVRSTLVHGRLASSIHFFDDLVAITVLLVVSTEVFTAEAVTSMLGYGVVFLVAAFLLRRHGFPLLFRLSDGSDELVLMGSISILIAFIAAAEYVGVSIVVGAFAAGIAIHDEGANVLELRNGVESIRDFFVAIFFVTVGALVSVPTLETALFAFVLVVLVSIINPIVLVGAFTYEGYDARTAFLSATSLNQVSELALVIAIQAVVLDHLTIAATIFDAIILAAAITMVLTAVTRRHEDAIYDAVTGPLVARRQTRKIDDRSHVGDDLSGHLIIVGFGRQGRWLVETCEDLEVPYVVMENDPALWNEMRSACRNYVLGDAMAGYPWEKARLEDAAMVVSTVDHRRTSQHILDRDPATDVILRAPTAGDAAELLEGGATFVAVPSLLATGQLLDIIEAILDETIEPARLREEHRELLRQLERFGFGDRPQSR